MSDIIAQCNYDAFPRNISQNQIIQNNIELIGQNDDICVDLQTLYNTVINTDDDMGSTYKYTITPYTTDLQNTKRKKYHTEHFITDEYNILPYITDIPNSKRKKKHIEHFITNDYNKNKKISLLPFLSDDYLILGLCFLFLILTFILLMNKSCEKDY